MENFVEITTGKLDANAMVNDGKYDFYTSGIKKFKINIPAFTGPAITIAGNGATVGFMHLADGEFNAYQRTYVLTKFSNSIREFLFYEIGIKLPRKISAEARTGNIPYIVMDMLTNLDVFTPTVPEQQKIGNLFKQLDRLITLHKRKWDDVILLKKALLQKMFPKNGSDFPEIRFPEFTDAWEKCKLGEVAKRVKGNDGDMSLPTLTISAGSGWLDQKDRFSGNIAGSEQKNYTLLKRGQLSYNHGNSKLAKYGAVFVLRTYEKALVPRVYHSFTMLNNADADFIEFLFATKIPDKELVKKITSGARTDGLLNISFEGFMDIAITIPTLPEQQKIGNLFKQLDRLITLHK